MRRHHRVRPAHLRARTHPRLLQSLGVSLVLMMTCAAAIGVYLLLRPSGAPRPTADPTHLASSGQTSSVHTDQSQLPSTNSRTHSTVPSSTSTRPQAPGSRGTQPTSRTRTSHPRRTRTKPAPQSPPRVEPSSTSSSSPSAPQTTPADATTFAAQVVDLTNQQRAANGCPALTANPNLTAAAQGHSSDMAANNYFDHNSQDGTTPWQRMTNAGYTGWTSAGENIAEGQQTPDDVVQAWMDSPDHRANILNCDFNEIGVGYGVGSDGSPYWTQDFGQRNT